ncbi:ABC transporter permease [Labrys miyagiensis]|uniref:ABC transporter permease n=1 Tax=Labrys miyagiensis TaxID=346912 RepID=A0ABQ6CDE0_9HYPH|nr:Bax inhibitor-1/YccA family protein [Labrys miyagiensis]GLS17692.1 ABC transporter permease [Labrys miyagiensis]
MSFNDPRYSAGTVSDARAGAPAIDQGLRAFMLAVYNHMTLGVAITGLVAIGAYLASGVEVNEMGKIVALNSFGLLLFNTPLKWVIAFAPLGMVFWMNIGTQGRSVQMTRVLFYVFSALMGLSLSTLFLVYTHGSIARVFFVSAASFGALSLYGYTTRRDLSAFGSFLIMGLVGLLLASLVSLFFPSSMLTFLITVAGVGIFAGLTAYDTQMLKSLYAENARSFSRDEGEKLAVHGALTLYLDFINLFIMLLRLLGDRR